MGSKKQLLDPISTLCKIIELYFCDVNTKISIQNHILLIQKPCNYQFFIRAMNGDGKENVSELFNALVRVIKWYVLPCADGDEDWIVINKSGMVKRLLLYACRALKKLQKTYEYGNVILAIQFYINIVNDALDGGSVENKLPDCFGLDDDTLLDFGKIRDFWNLDKLRRVCDVYDNCFLLDKQGLSEMNRCTLVDGYLSSVNALLGIIDNDFQKLVLNNDKG